MAENCHSKKLIFAVCASFCVFSRSWHGNGPRSIFDQRFKFGIFNTLMSDVIITNDLIDDIIALILSVPPTSIDARLDQTPNNNETELSKSDSNLHHKQFNDLDSVDSHLYRAPELKTIRFSKIMLSRTHIY